MGLAHLAHGRDTRPGAILVHGRKIEAGAARALDCGGAGPELAGQKAARQRRPDHQPKLLFQEHGNQVPLQVAAGDGVVGLQGLEARVSLRLASAERLGDLPGRPIGDADITHQALAGQVVQRAQGLVDGGDGVVAVDLVEVDVIGLQPLQAALNRVHDVPARGAAVIGPWPHVAEHLGGQHHILAGHADVLQGLADPGLGLAERIDVGGVDEVDATLQGLADDRVDLVLVQPADRLPDPRAGLAAKGHRPQADFGHEQACAAKLIVFHGGVPGLGRPDMDPRPRKVKASPGGAARRDCNFSDAGQC